MTASIATGITTQHDAVRGTKYTYTATVTCASHGAIAVESDSAYGREPNPNSAYSAAQSAQNTHNQQHHSS
jgi:hypothetical protein